MFRNSGFTAGGSLALGIVRLTPFARLTAGEDAGEPFAEGVCMANIGPEQRRQRLRFGAQAFAVGLGLAALLIFIHANPLLRLGLFVPFVMGAEGFFQAREKT
jgi:hypothetical protein